MYSEMLLTKEVISLEKVSTGRGVFWGFFFVFFFSRNVAFVQMNMDNGREISKRDVHVRFVSEKMRRDE